MPAVPTFFFSHARQDREMPGNYLVRFFEDLEKRLAQWSAVVLDDHNRLGTIDRRFEHGADWDVELSRGLSSNRAFLAIVTPLYFSRPSCGKELGIFVRRSPGLGIDQNGALTGVDNVLVIRWLPAIAYEAEAVRDALIPTILRRIQDRPADKGDDPERTAAIDRYRRKGMEKCVMDPSSYSELLDLFVERIRAMADLPPANGITFAGAEDAFRFDWRAHLAEVVGVLPPDAGGPVRPQPLSSVVIFHVTRKHFTAAPNAVDFADQVIAESSHGEPGLLDRTLAGLLADLRTAGTMEGLAVFHAVSDPPVPATGNALIERLAALANACVVTAVVVDASIWPDGTPAAIEMMEAIARSPRWSGPIFVAAADANVAQLEARIEARALTGRRVAVLPLDSVTRRGVARRALVEERGRVLRASSETSSDAERVPLLSGITKGKTG